jgi:hypothetical protein
VDVWDVRLTVRLGTSSLLVKKVEMLSRKLFFISVSLFHARICLVSERKFAPVLHIHVHWERKDH